MPMKAIAALLVLAAAQSALAQEAQKPNGAPAPPARSAMRPPASAAIIRPERPASPRPTGPTIPPAPTPVPSPFAASPSTYAPHYTSPLPDRRHLFRGFSPFSFGYGYAAPYPAGVAAPESAPHDSPIDQRDTSGSIYLDVEPRTAQVYVDGFYIGILDDFSRMGVRLQAGRHWIDVRASGYEMLTIPVNISAGQPARFRGDLTAVRTPPPHAVPPRGPETIYVIPGCYAGNRPPRESALARGCDIARLHINRVSGTFCILCDR